MIGFIRKVSIVGSIAALSLALGGCEIGPKQSDQLGYRGTGMQQVNNPARKIPAAVIPAKPYDLPADLGPPASVTYKNVQVLGNVKTEEFNLLMAQMNQWIAPPEQGCAYCHNPENMADDGKYTKIVARRMLQMTQQINSRWSNHVKQTGVTCYTCHRGNVVPVNKWAVKEGAMSPTSITGNRFGQNAPDVDTSYASLPNNAFSTYFQGKSMIRVQGSSALPQANHVVSTKDAEKTYGLMMHMSSSLGVNCTFCHNTDAFSSWSNSRPQRVGAYYGIRMVRDINEGYINGLASVMPANRKGPMGDPYKTNCLTCHQGQNKPLGGVSMIAQAPSLRGPIGPSGSYGVDAASLPMEEGAYGMPAAPMAAPAKATPVKAMIAEPKKATPAH